MDLKETVIQELESHDRRRFDGDDNMAICITMAICFQVLIDRLENIGVQLENLQNITVFKG